MTVHPQPLGHDGELCAVSRYHTAAHAGLINVTKILSPSATPPSSGQMPSVAATAANQSHGESAVCSGILSDGGLTMVSVGLAGADQNTYD